MNHPYKFYGSDNADLSGIHPVSEEFSSVRDPYDLYDALRHVWCARTCAPRLRDRWTPENPPLGQCSITSFLAQDIFGGKVYGTLRPGGNYHCYNEVNGIVFDLTSEQFGEEKLDYMGNPEQSREVHFAKAEKKERYELLKKRLLEYLEARKTELARLLARSRELRNDPDVHYNCAQGVFIPFAEERGLTAAQAAAITENFGSGMRSGLTCGAITGGLMALGLCGAGSPKDSAEFFRKMKAGHAGRTECRDLLAAEVKHPAEKKPHCDGMVYEAVAAVAEILDNKA